MADETTVSGLAPQTVTPQAAGQAPAAADAKAQAADAPKTYDEKTVTDLRDEAAKWRTQLRETQAALKELQGAAGDNKALNEKLAALEAQVAEKAAAAERASKEAQVMRLAARAGVDPDVAALLDLGKLDLSDEKKALETLGKLKGASVAASQARPGGIAGGSVTDDELRARFFGTGRQKGSIFGG
jgi:hypothetical protein